MSGGSLEIGYRGDIVVHHHHIELRSFPPLGLAALAVVLALSWIGDAPMAAAAAAKQQTFAAPEQAVAALIAASRAGDTTDLSTILGPGSRKLLFSGDAVADRQGRLHFVAAFDEMHKIVGAGDAKAELEIGKDDWPFPIPLVKDGEVWRFDTKAGAQEIIARRIGRNELAAIRVCRAYVDAQRDYAANGLSGSELLEYAQHFMSRAGKHDGLYWPPETGIAESPMGPLIAQARAEGYAGAGDHASREPYHGYYYRILTRQGKSAPGGAYDYIVNGHMIGGFALVASPAKYGDSGVMTFIVNQDGVVYQKDLGRNSAALARHMTAYDPGPGWQVQK